MRSWLLISMVFCLLLSCSEREATIHHGNLILSFNQKLHSKVSHANTKKELSNKYNASEKLIGRKLAFIDFELLEIVSSSFEDSLGSGTEWQLRGVSKLDRYEIEKTVVVKLYDKFPDQAFINVQYVNLSDFEVDIAGWENHHYQITPDDGKIPFWSFQGESTGARKDWVLPLTAGFFQKNFMGMNNTDYGGGIPVVDIWRRDAGIAIGQAELSPKLVSLPVEVDSHDSTAEVSIQYSFPETVKFSKGDTISTYQTFVSVHQGDYYTSLKRYGDVLKAKGLKFAEAEPGAFEASWCAWGYMRDFTLDEIRGTIPKIKELGIKWVTIDDGYQQAEGDWHVNSVKFPKGDKQMKELVDEFHRHGLKVMLWWAPLAADPGSKLLRDNPDLLSRSFDGAPHYITWWDAYYLAPSYHKTIAHTKEMLDLFFVKWGVDGLKMDGQHLNAVSPDYHADHNLSSPEQAYETLPDFYKMIYAESQRLKPNAVLQLCPCGTCMSVFNMPYMNQAVASDPLNSWQIRLKGKTYKALTPNGAYFGDHVELSDNRTDFASSFGVGGVLGTKFTWPKENPFVKEQNLLTPEKELIWKHWLNLYETKRLSQGNYRGELYDIGYDIPETHVIEKHDTLYYAFYSPSWNGEIVLRGLKDGIQYKVHDYVNDRELGQVTQQKNNINVSFEKSLLVEVSPI